MEHSLRDGSTRPPYLFPEKPVLGQEATVSIGHGTMDWFQIGKGIHQGCILDHVYLTSMQGTSCEMLGWMKYKLESGLPGEISITSDTQMILPLC